MVTASGTITTTEEATICKDFDMLVTVQLLRDSPSCTLAGNVMRRTWGCLRITGETITLVNQEWQHESLQLGTLCVHCRTWSRSRHKSPKRCRCSTGARSPTTSGDREQELEKENLDHHSDYCNHDHRRRYSQRQILGHVDYSAIFERFASGTLAGELYATIGRKTLTHITQGWTTYSLQVGILYR